MSTPTPGPGAAEPPDAPRTCKSGDWWDRFWQRPTAARGRELTRRRTAEVTLDLLRPELDRLPPGRRLRVLDLGCGNGDLTPLLLVEPRLDVWALDLSAVALAQFRERVGRRDRLQLVRASVYDLPFPDGAFDAVMSFGYASAASYEGARDEVARALRPGGVAVVDFANPTLYHWLATPRATLRWYRRFRDPRQGQYHFGRRGLAEHFGPAGLRLERVSYLNAYPPLGRLASLATAPLGDRLLSRALGPALGRVLLAKLRKPSPSQ